jgi:hypothetical protein
MQKKTVENVSYAILDKGLKGHQKKKVQVSLKKLDIKISNL